MGFFQGKRRALFFGDPVLNEWRHGKVLSFEEREKRNYHTGEPEHWAKSGNPKMQYEVALQTDYRDPDDPLDDGVRWVFIEKVGYKQIGSLYRETLDAIKAAGGPMDLEVGADFACMIVGLEEDPKNPKIQYKRWKVAYRRPDEGAFFRNAEPDETSQQAPTQPPNWQPGARQPANGGSGTSSSPAATTAAPTGTPEDAEFAAYQAWRREQTQRAAQFVATSDKPATDEPPPWQKADQAAASGSRSPFA
jgi:hypothetical protein